MDVAGLLQEMYGRILPLAERAVDGLDAEALGHRPATGANTIGWLVWHMGRGIDAQLSQLTGDAQLWVEGPWAERCGLDPDPANTGYGHTPEEVAAVKPEGPDVLIEYLRGAQARMEDFLSEMDPDQLDRVVDERWEPPVTLGVRLVSIADDCLQHVGQAAYIRGLIDDRPGAED
jgi:hypothetical protein